MHSRAGAKRHTKATAACGMFGVLAFVAIGCSGAANEREGPRPDAGQAVPDAGAPMPDIAPPHACGEAPTEDGAVFRYVAASMLNDPFGSVGFDLDGYDSEHDGATGCGRQDSMGGIDRSFAYFVDALTEFSGIAYWDRADQAIDDGELRFELVVRGYDETGDDDCVWSRFELDGVAAHEFVPGVVVSNTLEVSGGAFPFSTPVPQEGVFVQVDVVAARASVPLLGGQAVLGGIVPWRGANRARIWDHISTHISESIDEATVDGIVLPGLDMDAPGSPMGACDALGFGVDVSFERVVVPSE